MEAWPQEHTHKKKSTKAAERVHGMLASQITRHSIFSLLHILCSPHTQEHISSFPTALAKLYYLSWHIDWLVQNVVWRHILTVFCYCTCQIQFVFCERRHPMSLLQIWLLNFRRLFVCVFPRVHCDNAMCRNATFSIQHATHAFQRNPTQHLVTKCIAYFSTF